MKLKNINLTSNSNSENSPKNNENNLISPKKLLTPNITAQQPENLYLQDAPKEGATRTPRPIVVEMPVNLTETIKKIADNCHKNFYVKTNENWTKLLADSFEIKKNLIDYLKSKNFKFYVTSDSIPPS